MADIGYRLIRAREARGLTLEDAERDTRISRRYLEALEDEQFEVIPAPVYARGFLRSYAQYLGMDPQELLALFPRGDEPRGANGARPGQASLDNPIPATSPSRPTWRQPPRFDSGRTTRPEPRGRRRQPPPPPPTGTINPPADDYVIGGPPPAALRPPARGPQLSTRQPAPRRPPARTTVAEPVIGLEGGTAAPTRRLDRPASERQRNLIVIVAGAGLVAVVVLAAILIATIGGGGGESPQASPTPATTGTATATSEATESAAAAGSVQPGVVPAVIGETEDDAVAAIQAAGLQPRVFQEASAEPEGTVTDQSPAAGTQLSPGSEVRIVVSAGQ